MLFSGSARPRKRWWHFQEDFRGDTLTCDGSEHVVCLRPRGPLRGGIGGVRRHGTYVFVYPGPEASKVELDRRSTLEARHLAHVALVPMVFIFTGFTRQWDGRFHRQSAR